MTGLQGVAPPAVAHPGRRQRGPRPVSGAVEEGVHRRGETLRVLIAVGYAKRVVRKAHAESCTFQVMRKLRRVSGGTNVNQLA